MRSNLKPGSTLMTTSMRAGSERIRRKKGKKKKKSLTERAFERIDVKKELNKLEGMLEELKVDYEQFFLGLVATQPDKLNKAVKRQIRKIREAPFKKQEIKFRQLALESRYQTYNDYWKRTLRQKEEGTYSKDLFKLELKKKLAAEEAELGTAKGAMEQGLKNLFKTYKTTLEKQTGRKHKLDYNKFRHTLLKKAQAHKAKHKDKKITFKVVVKGGKVSVKAQAEVRNKKVTKKVARPEKVASKSTKGSSDKREASEQQV